jgi:hypothetical protein
MLPIDIRDIDQAKVRLMHQGRGLDRPPGLLLVLHVMACNATEFLVNTRHKPVQRTLVATGPGL